MADKQIASLYADIGAKTDNFVKGAATVTGGLAKLGLSVGAITSTIGLLHDAWDFSVEGAQLERLASAGDEVARQYGGNMDLIIDKVKAASLGTVSEMDIISSSNRAMMLGLSADADKLANLMEVAAFRGRAMGVDTTKAFNDIVTGVGRASPLILDNLGIVINAKETYEKYAENIGKSASELTKAEKTQAIFNAVLDEGNKMLDDAGGLVLDNAGKIEKLDASWKDFTDNRKRESADMAASFAESAAVAIDGWDELFTAISSTNEIRAIAGDIAREKGGQWQKYFEEAQIQWAEQKLAVDAAAEALDNHAAQLEADAEAMAELQKVNSDTIDSVLAIAGSQQQYKDAQQGVLDKIQELRDKQAEYYPWEIEKIQETQAEIETLGEKYSENKDDYIAAMNEKLAMMAIEKIALSDGVEGFSDAEFEKARAILETRDIATAAAFEEQQAITLLTDAVAAGQVSVEDYGKILDGVMADGVISVDEVKNALNAMPTSKTVYIDIVTRGMEAAGDRYTAMAEAYQQSAMHGHAGGGSFLIPSSYGNEGFMLGNGDTASGGERITISPRGQSGGSDMSALVAAIPSAKANAKALARELMKMGVGQSR